MSNNESEDDAEVLADKYLLTYNENGFFIEEPETCAITYTAYKNVEIINVTEEGLWVDDTLLKSSDTASCTLLYNKLKLKWKTSMKQDPQLVREIKKLNELLSHLEFVPGSSESFEAKERFEAMSEKVGKNELNMC